VNAPECSRRRNDHGACPPSAEGFDLGLWWPVMPTLRRLWLPSVTHRRVDLRLQRGDPPALGLDLVDLALQALDLPQQQQPLLNGADHGRRGKR